MLNIDSSKLFMYLKIKKRNIIVQMCGGNKKQRDIFLTLSREALR